MWVRACVCLVWILVEYFVTDGRTFRVVSRLVQGAAMILFIKLFLFYFIFLIYIYVFAREWMHNTNRLPTVVWLKDSHTSNSTYIHVYVYYVYVIYNCICDYFFRMLHIRMQSPDFLQRQQSFSISHVNENNIYLRDI